MTSDPHKLLADYERGRVTQTGLVLSLIQAAVDHSPQELLPLLPDDIKLNLRQLVLAYAAGERRRVAWNVTILSAAGYHEYIAEQERLLEAGYLRWQEYFESAE